MNHLIIYSRSLYNYLYIYINISDDVFDGNYNSITLENIFLLNLVCKFDLQLYPFDKQQCLIVTFLDGVTKDFVVLRPKELSYLGKRKLSEYEVTEIRTRNISVGLYSGHEMEIVFKNMYMYFITSTYIPTILLVIISYFTFWFDLEDFSNRIMVCLTALLVLAALFSQISSSLPTTSYLKLIDIWFIVCIILDFFMILMLVIINRYTKNVTSIKCKESWVNFSTSLDAGKINRYSQIIFLFSIILFVVIYFISVSVFLSN